jgi:hypothetical protein
MWFLLGLVALTLSVVLSYWLRVQSRWSGEAFVVRRIGGEQQAPAIAAQYLVHRHKGDYTGCKIGISGTIGARKPVEFHLRRENWFDRFGKRLGVTREQGLGNRELDQQLFLDSDDQRVGTMFQQSEPARLALAHVLSVDPARVTGIYAHAGRFWIDLNGSGEEPDEKLRSEIAAALDALLVALQKSYADVGVKRSAGADDAFLWRASMILAISTGSLIFGVIALSRIKFVAEQLDPYQLWIYGLIVGVVLTIACFVFAWRSLHASARAHVVLFEIATLGLIGFCLTSKALLTEINMEFDRRAPSVLMLDRPQATHTTYRCGKRGRRICDRYTLAVPPEHFQGRSIIKIDEAMHARLHLQRAAIMKIKPGALGVKWIESISVATDQPVERTL